MLGDLEDRIEARLLEVKTAVPRLEVASYGGELSSPDLLPGLLSRCPAMLVTMPRAVFQKRSQQRYTIGITFRLIIAAQHPRNEKATRRGTGPKDPGSYELWQACMKQLVGWQPWPNRAQIVPTELSNLINGRFQSHSLSVLGQTFSIELDWEPPEQELPDLLGIDIQYSLPPDNPGVAGDSIDLEA